MWVELNKQVLLTALSAREADKLGSVATGESQDDVLRDVATNVANDWRSGIRRHTTLDIRRNYVPDDLLSHILADYRYRAFTRIPGMSALLDELRVEEWRRANTVRDNLAKVSIEPPDEEHATPTASSGRPQPSISAPESSILG